MVGCAEGGTMGRCPILAILWSSTLDALVDVFQNIDLHVLTRPKTCGRVLDQKPGEPWRRVVTETKA